MAKISIILLFAFATIVQSAKFPSDWKKCPKTNNEDCLKEAMADAVKKLKDGNKELNVIPLDPLHFKRMELNQGDTSPVNVNLTYYDIDIIGPSRMKIKNVKVDWDKFYMQVDADVVDGPAYLIGDYTVDGKVLVLPIQGKGRSNITLDDFSVLITLEGTPQMKNNKKYIKIDKCDFVIRSKRVHLYFGGLFDGVPNLGESMNTFLNENWREIMGELNATISNAIGAGVKEIANNFFQKIPVTQLYT